MDTISNLQEEPSLQDPKPQDSTTTPTPPVTKQTTTPSQKRNPFFLLYYFILMYLRVLNFFNSTSRQVQIAHTTVAETEEEDDEDLPSSATSPLPGSTPTATTPFPDDTLVDTGLAPPTTRSSPRLRAKREKQTSSASSSSTPITPLSEKSLNTVAQLASPTPKPSSSTSSTGSTGSTGSAKRRSSLAVQGPHRPLRHTTAPLYYRTKTLVLDLDETLIHSTSRGSRRGGHMIEVMVDKHACLYYVYKRPHVDYFLKKVSEWYKVVVFTASMAEYADPVIDWLDQSKKLVSKRYFRQSCTQRNGSYMKDLAIVEQDLSKICLVDNSPVSYALNQENGIPIEGWISDPNDEALLDLLPFLDALRFTEDVRSVLRLRGGS